MRNNNDKSSRRGSKTTRNQRAGTIRLQVERLECRRLLAGLNVSIYLDQNSTGSFEAAFDAPAPNRIVYIDLDKNGAYSDFEPLAITDQQGKAYFGGLDAGSYSIGLLSNEQHQQTIDPVSMSRPVSQPVSPDLTKLPDGASAHLSSAMVELQAERHWDFGVSLLQDHLFVGGRRQGESTVLELVNSQGVLEDSRVVAGTPESLIHDPASGRLALATDQATSVYAVIDGALEPLAILADAAAPLALYQNRLASADRMDSGSWIIWNTNEWMPIQREKLSDARLLDMAISEAGNRITALTQGMTYTADWVGAHGNAHIRNSGDEVSIRMGVRVNEPVPPFQVEPVAVRQIAENSTEQLELGSLIRGLGEAEYWFAIGSDSANSQVVLSPKGSLRYTPNLGFSGRDQVVFRVFDGISESQFAVDWQVQESNHPPTGIVVDVPAFAEDTPVGSQLGFVTIIDPNAGAGYRVTTSDPRFRVENGRLYLDAAVDFEREPLITLEFLAVDDQEQFSITTTATLTLVNVIEPPKAISLTNTTVNEKSANQVVGQIVLSDPDSEADYQITVSDPRFAVQGDQLLLVEQLYRRDGSQILIGLTVSDRSSPLVSRTETFTLTVIAVSDAPRDIVISSNQVPELTPGGVVGTLSAIGLSDGEQAQFEVSDSRFEVVEGVLKLRSDVVVQRSTETSIALAVTATSIGGSFTVVFPLAVVFPRSPWQNPLTPPDVNGDGRVSAIDVLQIINHLNQYGSGVVPPAPQDPDGSGEPPPFYPDVNGDGRVSALDALMIINLLNARANLESQAGRGEGVSGEGEDSSTSSQLSLPAASNNAHEEREARRRKNLQIDSELEVMLEQLARDKR